MARPHRLRWTGVDLVTSLAPAEIWVALDAALPAAPGTRHLVGDEPTARSYEVVRSETLLASAPELAFEVRISAESGGRRAVRSRIVHGRRRLPGQRAYLSVMVTFAEQVRRADPDVAITLREGPMPADFDLAALDGPLLPPPA